MAHAKIAPEILAHLEWLGFVQPTGLVVSAPALVRAGAVLDRRDVEGQLLLANCTAERTVDPEAGPEQYVPDFESFARAVLGWSFSSKFHVGTEESPVPTELEVALPEFEETLRPDFAVREPDPNGDGAGWQLLVRVLETGEDFDEVHRGAGRLEASAHGRMERLLRQTGVLAGVLFNGTSLRLISAPRGESSGWFDVRVADMLTTAGRPICTAVRLLLSERRLLTLPRGERLTALLDDSRRYQNEVSERLAEQVLHALYELLRGFQAANDSSGGELLRTQLREHADGVYHALLTVLLRLVFVLYAEERSMLPDDEAFVRYYSLAGLHERLREDAALYPDTMDQRFGAWAQLLTLFRIVHDGAAAGNLRLPERHGGLFNPDRFPFLEGRASAGSRQIHERIEAPLVPDGTVHRALEKLLVLDGERISYRALDVEQIGSVYETMMGFRLETAEGRSLAVKPAKRLGAPVTINLEELLGTAPEKRDKWFVERTDRKLAEGVKKAIKVVSTLDELHAALEPVVDRDATPDIVAPGSMVLQPSKERRSSGSHYTPRSLTEPIVRTALAPILERLSGGDGAPPPPSAILDLKVCDPAMGSGAFLVETCRQLADVLIDSWEIHGGRPDVPVDEDEVVFARRLVAQRCLYGVDRNPVAVDLAKMSLWLITLAREHPLTFVDHALKHGDSLVGLSRQQIEAFHWDPTAKRFQAGFETMRVSEHVVKVTELRRRIREADESVSGRELRALWDEAKYELAKVRLFGDLVITAFFEGEKPSEREVKRSEYAGAVVNGEAEAYGRRLEEWRHAEQPLAPFHWQVEFPEVFEAEPSGFDAVVGNPPFAGRTTLYESNHAQYTTWLKLSHAESHGNADLVAHFFRRSFDLLRSQGTFGLIATNTIRQGDTRSTGLRWIVNHNGMIFNAVRRLKWPGRAAVVVSVVHVAKGSIDRACVLDGREVEQITAYLFHTGTSNDPHSLAENRAIAFQGPVISGVGFTFDDDDSTGWASSLEEMRQLELSDPRNGERIFPFIGGAEILDHPRQAYRRFVISFGELPYGEIEAAWPDLLDVLRRRVKPDREERAKTGSAAKRRRAETWWRFAAIAKELERAKADVSRTLVLPFTSSHLAFSFQPAEVIVSAPHITVAAATYSAFCALQARPHEGWARFFASSLKDDLRYTPSDCFDTFPFPSEWKTNPTLEIAGRDYYDFRAALMIRNNEGLTKTYNRFNDPDERDPDIFELRGLHTAMDRAVLDAYGWSEIPTECEFLLDYEAAEEGVSRKKKPWRYRWPDEVRDEVLARLLELNAERAAKESQVRAGKRPARTVKRQTTSGPKPERLFLTDVEP
ncbi:MAG: DNA methyltransferase [Actinomycetota bacterium]